MNYQEFVQMSEQASKLMSEGKYAEAEDPLYTLLMSDISDIDKAKICVQQAIIHDRLGSSEEVLGWYEKGIAYEQPHFRYQCAIEKAHYLAELGRCTEAVPIFEELLKQSYVTEAEKELFRREIKLLLSRAIGQWK